MAEQSTAEKATNWLSSAREYYGDLKTEMRRVTWPTWGQVRATTTVVIVTVFLFAVFFAIIDFLIGRGVTKLLEYLA